MQAWRWKLENKLENEVKIQNFPHKMSIKPNILRLRQATLVKQDQLLTDDVSHY